MSELEQRVQSWGQFINTLLTGLLTAGICWLLLEVNASRERWARLEERITTQSLSIQELRTDISQWNQRREGQEQRFSELDKRVAIVEQRLGIRSK